VNKLYLATETMFRFHRRNFNDVRNEHGRDVTAICQTVSKRITNYNDEYTTDFERESGRLSTSADTRPFGVIEMFIYVER